MNQVPHGDRPSVLRPQATLMAKEILEGLSRPQKRLPAKYLYDARGSALFDQITALPEYYLTRAELRILSTKGREIGELIGPGATVIEFGSAGATKARTLLREMVEPAAYRPIDMSEAVLEKNVHDMRQSCPQLLVEPVCADFTRLLPQRAMAVQDGRRLLLFLGSSIGNFTRVEALTLLRQWRLQAPGACILVGADLDKDPKRLLAAYDDRKGVTSAFNRNILRRLNRDLRANFDVDGFAHRALYKNDPPRVEMHLESLRDQSVTVGGVHFFFAVGETIHTESSHKYTVKSFLAIAKAAGWRPAGHWMDPEGLFSLHYLVDGDPDADVM